MPEIFLPPLLGLNPNPGHCPLYGRGHHVNSHLCGNGRDQPHGRIVDTDVHCLVQSIGRTGDRDRFVIAWVRRSTALAGPDTSTVDGLAATVPTT